MPGLSTIAPVVERFALGLLVLSIHSVPSELSVSHRYCVEVVGPLLRSIRQRPALRVSLVAYGSGLAFLASEYPAMLDLLSGLAADGQVELISTSYVPYSWWHFPCDDLLRSIELNRRDLEALGLAPSRAFFGADGHIGPGLRQISGACGTIICDAARLAGPLAVDPTSSAYNLGDAIVVSGCNRIAAEVSRSVRPEKLSFFEGCSAFERTAAGLDSPATGPSMSRLGEVGWRWYHFGGAHEICCRHSPAALHNFFYDDRWAGRCFDVIEGLAASGYRLETIGRLGERIRNAGGPASEIRPDCDTVIDLREDLTGGREAGRQSRRAAQASVLTMSWKTRNILCGSSPNSRLPDVGREAWRQHQTALLWPSLSIAPPGPDLVRFCKTSAEAAYRAARGLSERLPRAHIEGGDRGTVAHPSPRRQAAPPVGVQFFGADGTCGWEEVRPGVTACRAHLVVEQDECGIGFDSVAPTLAYSPSGVEDALIPVPNNTENSETTLALANGLLRLDQNLYLIRLNESWAGPATVLPGEASVWFAASGAIEGTIFEWSFLVFQGAEGDALRLARRVNRAAAELSAGAG